VRQKVFLASSLTGFSRYKT